MDRAHVFFWTELCVAAGVSVVGNATQAVLHTTAMPAVAATVAVIPPLALLAAVHGVALLTRAHTASPTARRAATALTAVIAGGAFWLSFTALRALAITAGVPAAEAWLWPLIVEGSMTQSSLALLTLAHTQQPDTDTESATPAPAPQPTPELPESRSAPVALPAPQPTASEPVEDATLEDPAGQGPDLDVLAALICEQDPGGRRDRGTVTKVLAHRYVTSGMPVVSLASSNVAARRSAESCATPSGYVRTQPPAVHTQRPSH
ncbi:DUF2637 domain-containing protein [Nocardia salmonicida]|uniref:DUF2637 domain-containing protein n=1 Tax=Nocardia salmonicida TaxID=53431 RepID=UPI0007A3D822|nr:DUF2637 domain-containing protein [Nocardia salmonicida]